MTKPDATLWKYLEQNILPRYAEFDAAHRAGHVRDVLRNSLEIARDYHVNGNMVITVAAYHDLGLSQGRENHQTASGEILMRDRTLRNWFTEEELAVMREAVEDHRASTGREPRSLYGKIVSEADRSVDPEAREDELLAGGLGLSFRIRDTAGAEYTLGWNQTFRKAIRQGPPLWA